MIISDSTRTTGLKWVDGYGKDKVTSADTKIDYLENKIVGASGIAKSTLNPAGNEQVQFAPT